MVVPVLNLVLPTLKAGQKPMTFPKVSEGEGAATTAAPWIEGAHIAPQGLAFCQRIELMRSLHEEEERARQYHMDPNAAPRWDATHDGDADSSSADENGEAGQGEARQHTSRKKRFTKLSDDELLVDWYDVLKLKNGEGATDDQIKLAYRRRCLETHPDKQKNHSDELFKKVQRAFEILGDPDARQAYDSSRPFDDTIPGDNVEESAFYATFGPVFDRNRRWSCDPNLPFLGSDKTPYKDVLRFYDRWAAYQSWRDFSHLADLEEIDDSMCREEKRYYMRENERQLAYFRKEEQKRIRTLVERARKNDPRLRRKREIDEEKRRKDQEEREAFRKKIREEEDRRRAEQESRERQKKEEAIKAAQDAKSAMRRAQQSVLEFLENAKLLDETPTSKLMANMIRRPNIVWLFSKITAPEEAAKVATAIQEASTAKKPLCPTTPHGDGATEEVEAVVVFNRFVEEKEKQTGFNRYGEAIKKASVGDEKKSGSSTETLVNKRPSREWTEDDLQRLQKATAKYPPGTIERWSKIAVAVKNHFTEEQCMAKVSELAAALQVGAVPPVGVTSAAAAHAENSSASLPTTSSVEDWTIKQQKQLEQGLRELKDYKENDKFQKIAKMVEGKNAKECFDRFKHLRNMMKKR